MKAKRNLTIDDIKKAREILNTPPRFEVILPNVYNLRHLKGDIYRMKYIDNTGKEVTLKVRRIKDNRFEMLEVL